MKPNAVKPNSLKIIECSDQESVHGKRIKEKLDCELSYATVLNAVKPNAVKPDGSETECSETEFIENY